MNVQGFGRAATTLALTTLAVVAVGSFTVEAATIAVNCSAGDTIAAAHKNAREGDKIEVSGSCTENVTISKDRLKLVGLAGATVTATDPTQPTITVQANNVRVTDFASITGGRNGIRVRRSGAAVIRRNTIEGAASTGIEITEASYALIADNMVQNNGSTSAGNVGHSGIAVNVAAAADISNNTIVFNLRHGIVVSAAAAATIDGNQITDNGRHGIVVTASSHLQLSEISGGLPNVLKRNGNNTVPLPGFGVACSLNASLRIDTIQTFGAGPDANATGATTTAGCPMSVFNLAGDPNF